MTAPSIGALTNVPGGTSASTVFAADDGPTPGVAGPASVTAAADQLRVGGFAVIQDDRRDISYLVVVAAHCDANTVNRMASDARGLICLALPSDHCDRLGLPDLLRDESAYPAPRNTPSHHDHLPFTRSIEARYGVTTGISTADRARTIAVAAAPDATAEDVVVPGHVFPLRARRGTPNDSSGIAEAAVTLAELAGSAPAAVVCALLDDDGEVARGDQLTAIVDRLGLPLVRTSEVGHRAG